MKSVRAEALEAHNSAFFEQPARSLPQRGARRDSGTDFSNWQMVSAGAMGGGISSLVARALGAGRRDEAAQLLIAMRAVWSTDAAAVQSVAEILL